MTDCLTVWLITITYEVYIEWSKFPETSGDLQPDELAELDTELVELNKMWLEARERQLGYISAYTFDLQSQPPNVSQAARARRKTTREAVGG